MDLRLSLDADQALVEPLVGVDQGPGVDPEQVEDRGLDVADVDRVLGHVVADVVGLSEGLAPLIPPPAIIIVKA